MKKSKFAQASQMNVALQSRLPGYFARHMQDGDQQERQILATRLEAFESLGYKAFESKHGLFMQKDGSGYMVDVKQSADGLPAEVQGRFASLVKAAHLDPATAKKPLSPTVDENTRAAMNQDYPPMGYNGRDPSGTVSIVERVVENNEVAYTVSASFDSLHSARAYLAEQKTHYSGSPREPGTTTSFYMSQDEQPHNAYGLKTELNADGTETITARNLVAHDRNGIRSAPAHYNRTDELARSDGDGMDMQLAIRASGNHMLEQLDRQSEMKDKDLQRLRGKALAQHGYSSGDAAMVNGDAPLPEKVQKTFEQMYDARYPSAMETLDLMKASPEEGGPQPRSSIGVSSSNTFALHEPLSGSAQGISSDQLTRIQGLLEELLEKNKALAPVQAPAPAFSPM